MATGTRTERPPRTQSKRAVDSVMRKRVCPIHGGPARIEIATMTDGWEVWHCTECGGRKEYRVT